MGLLRLRQFSSIPNFFEKIRLRTSQQERVQQSTDFNSFIVNNGLRILVYKSAGAGAREDMYTVPEGKVFYLISLGMSTKNTGTTTSTSRVDVKEIGETFGTNIIELFTADVADAENMSLSFTTPIKFLATEVIRVHSINTLLTTTATISGYELDEKVEAQRY